MENVNIHDHLLPTHHWMKLMTSGTSLAARAEFRKFISNSDEVRKLAEFITSDSDFFVRLLSIRECTDRVCRMLGISEEINSILFKAIVKRLDEIMTNGQSLNLGLTLMRVCKVHQRYGLVIILSGCEYGWIVLKHAMTLSEDRLKDDLLSIIANIASWITTFALGKSLTKMVLQLDFTHKTTRDQPRLHDLMAEFDEILRKSDMAELNKLALKLTSDSDLFMDFVKTRRGGLLLLLILGESEEFDTVFFEAIRHRLIDVITIQFNYGFGIVSRLNYVFAKRGNIEVKRQNLDEIARNALYLMKNYRQGGNMVVLVAIDVHHVTRTAIIASQLQHHYLELSLSDYGSEVVKKLVGECESRVALIFIVMEIMKCDEDRLVRLAKDKFGNKVLKTTLEFAKKVRSADLFGDLLEKFKPILDHLRGSQGENIAAIIHSETVKDRIVSKANH